MSAYGADDLASLPELDENILLQELKIRFQQNIIYVSTLNSLVVVYGELQVLPLVTC